MATLTAKLTLTSSNISSDVLNLSVTNTLTTTTPNIGPGEFAFFAVNDGNGLEARADTATCSAEYAYWKKG